MTTTLEQLIARLEAIAKKNDDEFDYDIGVDPGPAGGIRLMFSCTEQADHHAFVNGWGDNIEEMVEDAIVGIPSSLQSWGYAE